MPGYHVLGKKHIYYLQSVKKGTDAIKSHFLYGRRARARMAEARLSAGLKDCLGLCELDAETFHGRGRVYAMHMRMQCTQIERAICPRAAIGLNTCPNFECMQRVTVSYRLYSYFGGGRLLPAGSPCKHTHSHAHIWTVTGIVRPPMNRDNGRAASSGRRRPGCM